MSFRRFLLAVLLVLIGSGPYRAAAQSGSDWQPVAEGVEYREYRLPGPNRAYVTRMDRANPRVTLESSLAQGQLSDPLDGGYKTETVTGMTSRYNDSLNTWGGNWGNRSRVIAAINGYFFGADGIPRRGQVLSGWYAKRFDDHESGSGLAYRSDGSLFVGGCVTHPADKQRLIFPAGDYALLDGLNVELEKDSLVLYTPQWGAWTPATSYSESNQVEILVEMKSPTGIATVETPAQGVVREIRPGGGGSPIYFDQVVLSAHGAAAVKLKNKLAVGDPVGIAHTVRNCPISFNSEPWAGTYTSIGGSFEFLLDGEIQRFDDPGANVRNPRTALAYNDRYLYFIVVDGRNPSESVGMTMQELGEFARDELGAAWGVNQDGGGSSTLVLNGQVMNNTYCNNVRCQARIYLPFIVTTQGVSVPDGRFVSGSYQPTPLNSLAIPPKDDPAALAHVLPAEALPTPPSLTDDFAANRASEANQRAVANGLMMVVVEPRQLSTRFAVGQSVRSLEPANLRSGPGTNYALIAAIPPDTRGTIQAHANGLNGVVASGQPWWLVEFRTAAGELLGRGWISEALLGPGG